MVQYLKCCVIRGLSTTGFPAHLRWVAAASTSYQQKSNCHRCHRLHKTGTLLNGFNRWISAFQPPNFCNLYMKMPAWWFKVTYLGWLSDLFKRLSDPQLGDKKATLNHLELFVSVNIVCFAHFLLGGQTFKFHFFLWKNQNALVQQKLPGYEGQHCSKEGGRCCGCRLGWDVVFLFDVSWR